MRRRLGTPLALATALLAVAGSALAARTETGAAYTTLGYHGRDQYGKVTSGFTVIPIYRHDRLVRTDRTLTQFRFATVCNRRATKVHATIKLAQSGRFAYSDGRFAIAGHVIGNLDEPRRIVGTARDRTYLCDTGPLAFSLKP